MLVTDPWVDVEAKIRAAVSARDGARAAFRHSPNHNTLHLYSSATSILNTRLEELWDTMDEDQRAEAARR